MNILAFDCSMTNLQIAILKNQNLIAKLIDENHQSHSELLVSKIQEILQNNNLTYQSLNLLAVGNGPGSFTAIRVALAVAKMIKLACNIPVITVNNLELLAFIYKFQYISTKDIGSNLLLTTLTRFNNDQYFFGQYSLNQQAINITKTQQLIDLKSDSQLIGQSIILSDDHELEKRLNQPIIVIKKEIYHLGLLAIEKFHDNNFSTTIDPIYLLQPNITSRKK